MLVVLGVAVLPSATAFSPSAESEDSIGAVGPLFFPSSMGFAADYVLPHYCSASVVHSKSHDLVLTAAHCVLGDGRGMEFAPGYHDGISPNGVWEVQRVYLAGGWLHGYDPQDDVAVLVVDPHGERRVEDVVRAPALGPAPTAGTAVTVDGYVAGPGGRPITCSAEVYYTEGYPSFDCDGYSGGVSGGPWLTGRRVVGVIGGLLQGGCSPATSYTAAFGADVADLLARADAGGPGDAAPAPVASGC